MKLAIDVELDFMPQRDPVEGKAHLLDELRNAALRVGAAYLAADFLRYSSPPAV